ncbi:UNVERIFIED_CONTAM: hypothetical protein K2H54_030932 [Gekko kuhli]
MAESSTNSTCRETAKPAKMKTTTNQHNQFSGYQNWNMATKDNMETQALLFTQTGVETALLDLLRPICASSMGPLAAHALLVYLMSDVDVDAVADT